MNNQPKQLNQWIVYGFCLLISTIFFFLFGFNSPIYKFNSDNDYQWFMTMGNGLVHGKIPYRDLFEQKGPIVYFVTAFCCLFQNPGIVMLFIEILSMSLFFFFAFRICNKHLNTFYALLALPILAFAIFTAWCRPSNGSSIEEFCLPIYSYFLLCWLEFVLEEKHWNWLRSLYLGLCFGFILWTKFTLFYFVITPMIIWFIITIYRCQYFKLITNALFIFLGIITISTPIIIFYLINNAFDDLFNVYFFTNLTSYNSVNLFKSIHCLFMIGPIILVLILVGVVYFIIKNWKNHNCGCLLLIAFTINTILLVFSANEYTYYYIGLFPYGIFGTIYISNLIKTKLPLTKTRRLFRSLYISIFSILCLIICIPCSPLTREWNRNKNDYIPLVIADIISNYEIENNTTVTLFCYNIHDYGFYNTTNIIPSHYYYAKNNFTKENLPQMHKDFKDQITNQASDFVITTLHNWNNEITFLSKYYKPYTGNIETSTYTYKKLHFQSYLKTDFVLLIKNI